MQVSKGIDMSKDNDGPAFPGTQYAGGISPSGHSEGMTLRDYFAAKVLQGICSHHDTWGLLIQDIADRSYEIADAMLIERMKP